MALRRPGKSGNPAKRARVAREERRVRRTLRKLVSETLNDPEALACLERGEYVPEGVLMRVALADDELAPIAHELQRAKEKNPHDHDHDSEHEGGRGQERPRLPTGS